MFSFTLVEPSHISRLWTGCGRRADWTELLRLAIRQTQLHPYRAELDWVLNLCYGTLVMR